MVKYVVITTCLLKCHWFYMEEKPHKHKWWKLPKKTIKTLEADFNTYCLNGGKQILTQIERNEIPSWCPLPDLKEKGV